MTIEHRTGDLFDQPDLIALGQGVNCQGVMANGIAPLFKDQWPAMYREYCTACLTGSLSLGGLMPWQDPEGKWIYNIASQQRPGRNANLSAIKSGMIAALNHAGDNGIPSFGIPRIGSGIGGLRWVDVHDLLHDLADNHPVTIVIVSVPGADSKRSFFSR